eukprot:CAMPEP_0196582756 /NCGR_PEP_ID=MMETSP1081-20130531/40527_1 /TAXON_ID=36882 /ORGANISM="Pyramimonas amylifera, Strain CCMP720" /LENGTH=196 /DNA_ID=CAMNT_0041903429 /DNA_START=215 /DNA_END=805 /DNA_ORIENTATION=+
MTEGNDSKDLDVIHGLDLKSYMGRWYEIAKIPMRFQPANGTNTRATYALQEDGKTVSVLNETFVGASRKSIGGKAFKTDVSNDEAKFKVQFWVPPFLPVYRAEGNYWVLQIGDKYEYAVVGEPDRRCLWILCRETEMEENLYNSILDTMKAKGFPVETVTKTCHLEGVGLETNKGEEDGLWWIKGLFDFSRGLFTR